MGWFMRRSGAGMPTRRSTLGRFDTPEIYFSVELASVDGSRPIADAGRSPSAKRPAPSTQQELSP